MSISTASGASPSRSATSNAARTNGSLIRDERFVVRRVVHGYPELSAAQRSWWLIVDPHESVDLCSIDPGFDVDLYVSVDLRTMTAIWMGLDTVRAAVANRRMIFDRKPAASRGHANLARAQSLRERAEARKLSKKMASAEMVPLAASNRLFAGPMS